MKPVIRRFAILRFASPVVEIEGRKVQPFDMLAFDKDGQTRVFAGHGK